MTECVVCAPNERLQRIYPGPVTHDGDHWLVEHAYPVSLLGWLVFVLKRHEVTPRSSSKSSLSSQTGNTTLRAEATVNM